MGSKGKGVGAHPPPVPRHSAAAVLQDPMHGATEQLINFRGVIAFVDDRFQAAINIFCNKVPLGVFDCPADAARAFDVAALALFDTAAVTNFPASNYGAAEVSTVRHALLHEHAKTQPAWNSRAGTAEAEAGADQTTCAASHPQARINSEQQHEQPHAKLKARQQIQQHSQPKPLAGAAPAAAATPGGAKQLSRGAASLHTQPLASDQRLKRHNSSHSADITAAESQQHDQQQWPSASAGPAAKRHKAAASSLEHAQSRAEALELMADQMQEQRKQVPTPDVKSAVGRHTSSPDQRQQQSKDMDNTLLQSTAAEVVTATTAEGAAQLAVTDKHTSAAVGGAQSLLTAADVAHAHPNMLAGLLCLIDAATNLSAYEQAELLQETLQDTQQQLQPRERQTAMIESRSSRLRTDQMQQQLDVLSEQQQQHGDSRAVAEATLDAAETQRNTPAGVVSNVSGLAAVLDELAAAKAKNSKLDASAEHTSSDGSDCSSWDAAAAAAAAVAGNTTGSSASPRSEVGGGAAAGASLRHSSRARKPSARIQEFDIQTLISQPQIRKKAHAEQNLAHEEQQTNQHGQQQKLKQQQVQQQHSKKRKQNVAAKATAKAKRMQGISTAVAAVITKGSASKIGTGPSVVKTQGPGCVSHAQNPTGQMGVRLRKGKYEAFVAVPPFRYLYLGQYETLQQAAVVRDTAMLAIFGKRAAEDFGSAWLSEKGATEISPEAVKAMAAKLYKKEHVAPVMVAHGTHLLVQHSEVQQAA